jgi:hypothetical protein
MKGVVRAERAQGVLEAAHIKSTTAENPRHFDCGMEEHRPSAQREVTVYLSVAA